MTLRFVSIGAAAAAFFASPSQATVLVIGSGWQADQINVLGAPSAKSAWSFTISAPSTLSVTDAFIPGDVYTLTGDVAGITSFYAGAVTDPQAAGIYGTSWTDARYSKIAVMLAPGTYSFSITGDGAGGTPAAFGVRLDASAVPEPSTWLMMTSAFGAMGITLRRRRRGARGLC